ncbi:MAG TPA: hypothetical protein DHV36_02210 [Desulfobacteraceae bacterium]|nr:hypothetical protein [Desulfobacteraceae bacterium]
MTFTARTIGIMTVNGFDFHPNGRFQEEAKRLGHRVMLINPYSLCCSVGDKGGTLFLSDHDTLPDLVMPRQGSPMGEYGFVLLRQFELMGIALVNGIHGVTIARNQFLSLQQLAGAGVTVPDACFVNRRDTFFEGIGRLGGYPVVAKQVDGMGGDGVERLDSASAAEAYLEAHFVPVKGVVLQRYIPPDHRTDLRLLVVGDRVAGAMALTPKQGQFKANIHQQAQAHAFFPSPELERMAVAAARACSLDIAGVDMMISPDTGPQVIEVNYSPGFNGLEMATGKNIAAAILQHVLQIAF